MAGYWDRILAYVRGGPKAIDGWPEQIPATEFAQAVALHLGAALERAGFQQVSDRRWVRSTMVPIRHVVELQALKGMSYCPQWGLSLDFVPHVTARGEIRWHRTPKAARFDFVHRPIDFEASLSDARKWSTSPLATRQELEDDLRRVAMLTVRDALPLFERATPVEALPALYAEHRTRPTVGLPFEAFPQQVLAEAFVAARCGRSDATASLSRYVASYDVPAEASRKLKQLLENEWNAVVRGPLSE